MEDIKLPPMTRPQVPGHDYSRKEMQDYARATAEPYRAALHDLVLDLEMRAQWKEGSEQGVVACGQGVYMRAKRALGEIE